MLLNVQLTISQHWLELWLGNKRTTSHCLNKLWPWSLTPHGVTKAHCTESTYSVNDNISRTSMLLKSTSTFIYKSNLNIIGLDNGLSAGRRQAIIWNNAGILLIGHLRKQFSEILIEIHALSFKKIHVEMSSAKWQPFCPSLINLGSCGNEAFTPQNEAILLWPFGILSSDRQQRYQIIKTLRPRQNGRHFADDVFKCISLNEYIWISIKFHWRLFPMIQLTKCQHWFR